MRVGWAAAVILKRQKRKKKKIKTMQNKFF